MKRSKNYRNIWERHTGQKIPRGYHIHHKDGNRTNDLPENLICVSPEEHVKLHLQMGHKLINGKFILTSNNRKGIVRSQSERESISKAKRGISTTKHTDSSREKIAISMGARPFIVEKSGKIVGQWTSISKAARALDINRGNLSSCLHGRIPHVNFFEARFI